MSNDASINLIRNFFKRFPRFYYFCVNVVGPLWWSGKGPESIIALSLKLGPVLNLGSGPKRVSKDKNVLNVDMYKFPDVDIVSDISNLPFEDESVGGVVMESVLEHLKEPERAVNEIKRVLKPGGYLYVNLPWFYPFHPSPSDYRRWSIPGLRRIFCDFEFVDSGVRAGPFSALVVNLSYLLALVFSFGFTRIYGILLHIFLLILFPIKFLDIVFASLPRSTDAAAELYFISRKKLT